LLIDASRLQNFPIIFPGMKMEADMKQKIKDYAIMTIGVVIAVFGLNYFLVPAKVAAGGISGIATILYHLFKAPLGISIAALNIPLFVFGVRLVGKSFAVRTAYSLVLYSVLAEIIPIPPAQDVLLASVYGGVLMGAGIGLVLRSGGSTGGTDMAARMLNARSKNTSIAAFMFIIDFVIIGAAGLIFNSLELALYAIASLFISAKVIDFFTDGLTAAKAFYIISDKSEEIAAAIMEQMDRGVTALKAKGVYSGKDKEMLLCVLQWRTEGPKLKSLVKSIDDKAFVIVADVKEVLGEGF
jgi:uncharacterized membrane-anchored protein YitT (DUF2179 family)